MSVLTLQMNLARVCAKFHDGQNRLHQAPAVRPWLYVLELEGLATEREMSSGVYGWKLTRAGIERASEARCCACEACKTWASSPGSHEEMPACANIPQPEPIQNFRKPQA